MAQSLKKDRIKIKYSHFFKEKYEEYKFTYGKEIKNYSEILSKLQNDIQKEVEERQHLAQLYDQAMNKGANLFVKETNYFSEFNSSSKITINSK